MLNSLYKQFPILACAALPTIPCSEKWCRRSLHTRQPPMDLGWAANPKATDFAGQASMALWPDSMSWISCKLSWVCTRRYWELRLQPYGLAIQGSYVKWSNRRREERKRERSTEQRSCDLWERERLHSLCFGPHRPSCALFPRHRTPSWAAQHLVKEHSSWIHLRLSPDPCWLPTCHRPHSLKGWSWNRSLLQWAHVLGLVSVMSYSLTTKRAQTKIIIY